MNKKFLSAILFGALMVTSTGTFVSCKDYDEDIDRLTTELSGVKTQITDLQNKINAGKWITNVSTTASGVSITLSDGQTLNINNGKDGATGEAGAPGTQWTISEDGFWVCDGEKTGVVAVGKDGKDGQDGKDAQPEVKYENGKWMLWNGTEYVAFQTGDKLPANAVYAVADVNDPNFVNLYYTNEAGEQVAVRMPMNEGLGQIVVLGADLDINYHRFNGAHKLVSGAWKETAWDGAKATPAKGEYMLTSNQDVVYVQVVPNNYDISKLNFKLVNTKGDEAPVVFGTPVPTTDAVSRAVSESGVYAIPYTLKDMTKAEITAFKNEIEGKALSLVANENVRSTYTYGVAIAAAVGTDATYAAVEVKPENMGEAVTIVPNSKKLVYDSYLVMPDTDAAKADSVRYGIKLEGMTISAYDAEKINGKTLTFNVRQLGATAKITTASVSVTFGKEIAAVTEVVLPAVEHNAVAVYWNNGGWEINGQYIVADFAPYFEKVAGTTEDRLMWNADMSISDVKMFWDQWNEFGESIVEGGIDVTSQLYAARAWLNAAGSSTYANGSAIAPKDYAQLYIKFKRDYPGITLGNGQLKAVVTLSNADASINHEVEVPFTIANPSAEEIAKVYAWDATYMKDGVLTIVDDADDKIALETYFKPTYYANAAFYGNDVKAKDANQKLLPEFIYGGTRVTLTGDHNKAYELKDLKVKLLGQATSYATGSAVVTDRTYAIPNLKVNFATATADHLEITGSVSVLSGEKSVIIKDAAIAEEGELQFKLVDYAGDLVEYDAMQVVSKGDYIANATLVNLIVYYNEDGEVIKTYDNTNNDAPTNVSVGATSSKAGKAIKITTTATKVAADTAQEIKVNFLKNSAIVVKENKIKVTVKAAI